VVYNGYYHVIPGVGFYFVSRLHGLSDPVFLDLDSVLFGHLFEGNAPLESWILLFEEE